MIEFKVISFVFMMVLAIVFDNVPLALGAITMLVYF